MKLSPNEIATYTLMGAVSALFAWLISQPDGAEWIDENTTVGVVIGSSVILAGLAVILPRRQWRKVALAFGVVGAPMVARKIQIGVV